MRGDAEKVAPDEDFDRSKLVLVSDKFEMQERQICFFHLYKNLRNVQVDRQIVIQCFLNADLLNFHYTV